VSLNGPLAAPELNLLHAVLGNRRLADRLARAPGGWRDVSTYELEKLQLTEAQKRAVTALQELVRRGYPELPKHELVSPSKVARVYIPRLGGLVNEVMLTVALDGRSNFLAEIEVARGGRHAMTLRVADILRPLLRVGATSFILLHNHPSGDPTPSKEDVKLTQDLHEAALLVGVPLVDHMVIGGRGGGAISMCDIGLLRKKDGSDD